MWRGMQKGKAGKAAKAGAGGTRTATAATRAAAGPVGIPTTPELDALIAKLHEMEDAKKDGVIQLPGGETLEITNLRKVFWPADGFTKGDLLRFYVRVSPWLLPVVAERPLVMKRFPNGVTGKAFYQQKAPDVVPPGVRVEDTIDDEGADTNTRRIVGGDLKTLLYMAQLGTISQDPWFSKYDTAHAADYVALDLDPMPGVPFAQVLDVARWVRDELERLGIPGVPKTSGSSGLHVYIPLPRGHARTRPAACCARSWRRSSRTSIARKRPSSGPSASAGAPSTSTTCRTSWARRWRRPTRPGPASSAASRRR